jgi:hypothetical protein
VKAVRLPAVALFMNAIIDPSTALTKFSVIPELFVIPMPLMNNEERKGAVIVNALAPALNTIPFTSVNAEREISILLERANVAVSVGPFGTVAGVQFVAVFQSLLPGLRFQVALPAKRLVTIAARPTRMMTAVKLTLFFIVAPFRPVLLPGNAVKMRG